MKRSLKLLLCATLCLSPMSQTALAARDNAVQNTEEAVRERDDTTRTWLSEQAEAEEQTTGRKQKKNFITKLIRAFDNYDTTYIEPNRYNLTFMLQNTNFVQHYRLRATEEEREQSIRMSPRSAFKVGPYFGWRWIFLGYTFDLSRPKQASKSAEFNLSLYSSRVGVDFLYIKNSDDFTINNTDGFSPAAEKEVKGANFNGLTTYTLSVNAYYVFNSKHFSYPAAFSQSTIQRKSAGSWMLGFRYDHQKLHFDHTTLPNALLTDGSGIMDELKSANLNYSNYSVSVGYAYNWVFAKNWLFSASVMPSIGYKKKKGVSFDTKEVWMNVKNLNVDFISRLGLVWNNAHWFAGLSYINHFYDYRNGYFSMENNINYINLYVGFNFLRRKK